MRQTQFLRELTQKGGASLRPLSSSYALMKSKRLRIRTGATSPRYSSRAFIWVSVFLANSAASFHSNRIASHSRLISGVRSFRSSFAPCAKPRI